VIPRESEDPLWLEIPGVPLPGVMGPFTPERGAAGWGAGASGTLCWECAGAPELKMRIEPRSAVVMIALEQDFTGISSSQTMAPSNLPAGAPTPAPDGRQVCTCQSIRRTRGSQVARVITIRSGYAP
jgi:hypothetical protein